MPNRLLMWVAIVGVAALAALAIAWPRNRPACRDSVRVLSWLHMDSAGCPRDDHAMSIERVGLKVIMRCTCRAGGK